MAKSDHSVVVELVHGTWNLMMTSGTKPGKFRIVMSMLEIDI